jgi:DNA polymerase-4
MASAVKHDAAPMRIPFQTLPDPDLEEETGLHGIEQAPTEAADLLQVRMNQFKVLAEQTHRERTRRHRPTGAGDWREAPPTDTASRRQAGLF